MDDTGQVNVETRGMHVGRDNIAVHSTGRSVIPMRTVVSTRASDVRSSVLYPWTMGALLLLKFE